ncbi:MAG: energy-coupling factor transporter transmembrane protein EcfT [Clostridia bacterium]|nr:energy-coupling factor transporter transmembrane protein EcfT [Clostridia bacterium]
MLKDITLGQYFPGDTAVHRLDPRTKILLVLVYIVLTFSIGNFAGYILFGLFTAGVILISKVPVKFVLKGIKPIMIFIIITGLFNLFLTPGEPIFSWWIFTVTKEGVRFAVFMVLRLFFLILGTTMLTLTTSPIALTDGIERLLSPFKRIGVPAHELAMMMSIALRFIPILMEETDKIIKAQSARGADFESGNIVRRAKSMIPILIPLFISAFRRADELATAMECRCYRGGDNRTRLKELKYSRVDGAAWITFGVLTVIIIVLNLLLGKTIGG